MKYIIPLLLFGLVISAEVTAQKTQTLFDKDIRHGAFGAPIFGITSVNGQTTYLRGTRLAWVINLTDEHTMHLGYGTYRTRDDIEPVEWIADVNELDLRTSYSGFEIEYANSTYRLFHFSAQTLIGSGRVRYRNQTEELDNTSDTYFALQPGANVHLNVTSWFRISGGVFYRYANGVDLEGTSSSQLSGVTSFVGLKFGKF